MSWKDEIKIKNFYLATPRYGEGNYDACMIKRTWYMSEADYRKTFIDRSYERNLREGMLSLPRREQNFTNKIFYLDNYYYLNMKGPIMLSFCFIGPDGNLYSCFYDNHEARENLCRDWKMVTAE